MPGKSIDKILIEDLKMDSNLLKSPNKIKKLYITSDGDIIDNIEIANNFVKEILAIRDQQVSKWFSDNHTSCQFFFEIYHPDSNEKFIELISNCMPTFSPNNSGELSIFYRDYVTVFRSSDKNINDKLFRMDIVEPLLFYLKNNGLIKDIKFCIK